MACYRRFRGLCTVWCSLEILLFAGIIYGWSSLVYIFVAEGFYAELCSDVLTVLNVYHNNTEIEKLTNKKNESVYINPLDTIHSSRTCPEQESRLGLWFSIGVGFTWAGMAILGPLSKALGTRISRIVILLVYEIGLVCLAFTSKDSAWLICPGLCCIGVGGLALFASNIQVANLFPTFCSTIVALFCGLFDSSSVIFQLIKIAHDIGIGRMESFLFFGGLHLVMVSTSTFFILPRCYITCEEQDIQISINDKEEQQYTEIVQTHKEEEDTIDTSMKGDISAHFRSVTYIAHVAWMTLNCLLFATFLNLLYIQIYKLAKGEETVVSYYLGIFAYTTIGSTIGSVIAGLIYDYQRKIYSDLRYPSNKWLAVVKPMIACDVFVIAVFGLMQIEKIEFLFPSFILFTLFRNFLFSTGVAFINDAFPTEYFGPLYGIMTLLNGLFSLLQYGIVKWTLSYHNAYRDAHIVLIILACIAFLHPLQLWMRSRTSHKQVPRGTAEKPLILNS